jgi:hypothetical protein
MIRVRKLMFDKITPTLTLEICSDPITNTYIHMYVHVHEHCDIYAYVCKCMHVWIDC